MYRKLLIAAAAVATLAAPAFAATTYYVGMDTASKKCEVTSTKPDGTKITLVGSPDTYATKAKADIEDARLAAREALVSDAPSQRRAS